MLLSINQPINLKIVLPSKIWSRLFTEGPLTGSGGLSCGVTIRLSDTKNKPHILMQNHNCTFFVSDLHHCSCTEDINEGKAGLLACHRTLLHTQLIAAAH